MRVLIADDSDFFFLKRLMEMLIFSQQVEIVGSFTNGIETLAGLRTLKPDLAIVGIKMPGLCGIEAMAEIMKAN